MQYYKSLTLFFAILIFIHSLISLFVGNVFKGRTEIFPFFNWQLFSHVPNKRTDYILKVISYRGKIYDPGEYFFQSDKFSRNNKLISNYYLIQRLGKVVNLNDKQEIKKYSRLVGNIIFNDHKVEFRIIRRMSHTSKKWGDGKSFEYKTIGTMKLNNNVSD